MELLWPVLFALIGCQEAIDQYYDNYAVLKKVAVWVLNLLLGNGRNFAARAQSHRTACNILSDVQKAALIDTRR